ncbi:hypothetical protein DPMN_164994 [Dreissena polymorpha]|uniref:Uncharacterized protein n=1 Tax=Dreissena polymorpha TaxID=45954 RepID=A0A9D4EUK3_DREPO|nr:hypothetical protein DPMN_164994 [Dreissena polymorpha]
MGLVAKLGYCLLEALKVRQHCDGVGLPVPQYCGVGEERVLKVIVTCMDLTKTEGMHVSV